MQKISRSSNNKSNPETKEQRMPDSYRIKSYYFSCPELQRIEQDPDLSFDGIVSIKGDKGNQVYLGYFSRNLSY